MTPHAATDEGVWHTGARRGGGGWEGGRKTTLKPWRTKRDSNIFMLTTRDWLFVNIVFSLPKPNG